MARPAVAVEDLHKTYVPTAAPALRGLWFEVGAGEIFGLLGPNGAGKSTTLGVLTTTVRPTRGRAVVAGYDVRRAVLDVRSRIGVVFQTSVVDGDFSVRENLRLQARLWRLPRRAADERIDELLAAMALSDRASDVVRTLSGGLRRRVELARALVGRPEVLLLDEPTLGLDPAIRSALWSLIARVRREHGTAVVLSTHYLEEAADVCDRVAIIDHGTLVVQGPPRALVDELGAEMVELRIQGDPTEALAAVDALDGATAVVRGDVVTAPVQGDRSLIGARLGELQARVDSVAAVTVRSSTLADVFAHLTGRQPVLDEVEA